MTVLPHLGAAQRDQPHVVPPPCHDGVGHQHVLPHTAEGGQVLDEHPIHAVKATETEGTAVGAVGPADLIGHEGVQVVPVAPRVAHEAADVVVFVPDPFQTAALQTVYGWNVTPLYGGRGQGGPPNPVRALLETEAPALPCLGGGHDSAVVGLVFLII